MNNKNVQVDIDPIYAKSGTFLELCAGPFTEPEKETENSDKCFNFLYHFFNTAVNVDAYSTEASDFKAFCVADMTANTRCYKVDDAPKPDVIITYLKEFLEKNPSFKDLPTHYTLYAAFTQTDILKDVPQTSILSLGPQHKAP